MGDGSQRLLVCTVGGTPDPIVRSLVKWAPARVLFVASKETQSQVDTVLRAYAEESQAPLSPGQYEVTLVADAEDLIGCVTTIRELEREVTRWLCRSGADYSAAVDFTAGTKCMSAALALVSQRWLCRYSYVGGSRRSKEGVGTVEPGTERVVHCANPWDALGYQAVEDFVVLFDQHAYAPAADVAKRMKERIDDPARKREMSTLEQLARAFDAWDRFDHKSCKDALDNVEKARNDLKAALGDASSQRLTVSLQGLAGHIRELLAAAPPSRHHVVDLLANAKRRKDEGRLDDAVARLYRAIEAVAQVALKERHGVESTEKVPIDSVPEPLRSELQPRVKDGVVALGLQDDYELLAGLKDPLAETFKKANLNGTKSPLVARNKSILAHGFERISQNALNSLWTATLALAGVQEESLPFFPTLGEKAAR
jgi:CRISPR-associated protein (TIGR02710 family)